MLHYNIFITTLAIILLLFYFYLFFSIYNSSSSSSSRSDGRVLGLAPKATVEGGALRCRANHTTRDATQHTAKYEHLIYHDNANIRRLVPLSDGEKKRPYCI